MEADKDGWIEWPGGECPVDECALVDIIFSNGKESHGQHQARAWAWDRSEGDGNGYDIVAYRLHQDASTVETGPLEDGHGVIAGANSELEREAAESAYNETAFDLESNPVGSRDWTIFWKAWQAKAALSTEAQPDGYFYETYSGSKGHFLGAIHDNTKWRVDHEDLKLTPFWLSAPQPPAVTEAQPEVTGAVAWNFIFRSGESRVITNKRVAECMRNTLEEGDVEQALYPPSAIEAAVREKLEARNIREVKQHGDFCVTLTFASCRSASAFKAAIDAATKPAARITDGEGSGVLE